MIVLVAIMAAFLLPSVVQAADRENYTVTKFKVKQIEKAGPDVTAITVADPVVFEDPVEFEGDVQTQINAATTATNAQVKTVATGINRFTASGGTNNATATITLTRPTDAQCNATFFIINTGTSNSLALASTGAWNAAAVSKAPGGVIILFGVEDADGTGTNAWYGF